MAVRAHLSLTQESLAKLADIPVQKIQAWEAEEEPIYPTDLYRITRATGLDFDKIVSAYNPDVNYDYFFSAVEFGVHATALPVKKKMALFDLAWGVSKWNSGWMFAA